MKTNEFPTFDNSVNTTGCCAKFNPQGWDNQDLHFDDMPFVHAHTKSAMYVPLNMGRVFTRVQKNLEKNDDMDPEQFLVLSRDLSAWNAEHLFYAAKPIAGETMTKLSGDFITKVFEGPYSEARHWHTELQDTVREKGSKPGAVYFFYTTCPKCAKAYGQNYVVGIAETR